MGWLEHTRRLLLDELPHSPSMLLCYAVLIAYIACALPDHALRLYAVINHAARLTLRSSHYTYSSVLTSCARSRHLRLGSSVHAQLLRRGRSLPDNPALRNLLFELYASCVQ